MEDDQVYYVRRQGRVQGPWEIARLRSEVKLRQLASFHELSIDGVTWMRAGELAGLFPKSEARRPRIADVAVLAGETSAATTYVNPSDQWYYAVNENQLGPMTRSELVEAVLTGRCPLDAMAWKEAFGEEWIPIDQVPELMSAIEAPRTGHPADEAGQTRYVETVMPSSGMAMYSIIAGAATLAVSWIPLLGFAGIIPILLGGYALYEHRASGGRQKGTGLAIGGMALGAASILMAFLVLMGVAAVMWWKS